jgi:hypothetical protein
VRAAAGPADPGPRERLTAAGGIRSAGGIVGLALLGVASPLLGPCRLVFQFEPGRVLLTTVIRYEHRISRPVWTVVGPVHRLVTRLLATHAAS